MIEAHGSHIINRATPDDIVNIIGGMIAVGDLDPDGLTKSRLTAWRQGADLSEPFRVCGEGMRQI